MRTIAPTLATLATLTTCAAVTLSGCVGGGQPASAIDQRVQFVEDPLRTVPPEDYAATFERARDALRAAGFTLARIDAAAGVITTEPLPGLAAWKSDLLREADLASAGGWHATTIEARAVFSPREPATDLRRASSPLTLHFEVVERREYRPSRRIDSTSVLYGSEFSDRQRSRQGLEPGFTVAFERSHRAEALLASKVISQSPQ